MIPGRAVLGSTPIARPASVDSSSLPPFVSLLANPDAKRIFLIEAMPFDPVAAAEVTVRFGPGRRAFRPGPGLYAARILEPMLYDVSLFEAQEGVGGAGRPSLGSVVLAFGDSDHDEMADYHWGGRLVRVLIGGEEFTYNQFQPVLEGRVRDVRWTPSRFTMAIADAEERLRLRVQETLYLGDDLAETLEGGPDLAGVPKPLAYGSLSNIEPVLVNRTSLVYQFHDGEANAVTAAYDRAEEYTAANGGANDITDLSLADVFAWTPVSGEYITDLAQGLVRLGSAPVGRVTLDVEGDAAGGYVETAADVIDRLVRSRAGFGDSDVSAASFSDLNTAQPAPIGLYVSGGQPLLTELLDEILASILGYRTWTRLGELSVGQVAFDTPAATLDGTAAAVGTKLKIHSLERVETARPLWRRSLGYARSWVVQGPDDVSSTATDARKDFVAQAYRVATDEDAALQTEFLDADDTRRDTLIADAADANSEATRQLALLGAKRDRYDVLVSGQQFRRTPGETITLKYPRWGLSAGRDFLVLGLREDTTTGRTLLRLWG